MHSLLVNGLDNGFFLLDNLNETTTKSIYLCMSEGDPPAKVELNYPDRDWQKAWERLNSGILLPLAKEHLFFILHDRVFTRERGYRLQFRNIDSPYCISCSVRSLDTVSHRYCECLKVIDAWNTLRDLLENLDSSLIHERDLSLINLCYLEPLRKHSVLWLIGEYIVLIEQEVIFCDRSISSSKLLSHLRSRWLECSKLSIPMLEFIPGLFPTGIGWGFFLFFLILYCYGIWFLSFFLLA